MTNAKYYANLLRVNQITPAAVEAKIRDLEIQLQDEEYFLQEGIRSGEEQTKRIDILKKELNEFRELLAKDYAEAVTRGLETTQMTTVHQAPVLSESTKPEEIVELWDGTRLSSAESQQVENLMEMARTGRITKQTLLEITWDLDRQMEGMQSNDPRRADLLMRRSILHHVITTGKFTLKRFRHYR